MSADLTQRVLTAAVAVPVLVALLLHGGWPEVALFSLAAAVATLEFYQLAPVDGPALRPLGIAVAAVLPWLPFISPADAAALAILLVFFASVLSFGRSVLRQDITALWSQAPRLVEGIVFCALGPFFLSSLLTFADGTRWVLAVVLTTFTNDACAYLGGKRFGRHHLAPRVSPGKTWEGFCFGALGSVVSAAVIAALWPQTISMSSACVLALITATVGPLGDLAKSLLKRSRGVKDSGRLFPGHGGMLDRTDALLVNAPIIWAWVRYGLR